MSEESRPRAATRERRDRLVDLVRGDGGLSIEQLAADLRVSASTVRRDLQVLSDDGRLLRVLGGAVAPAEPTWHEKEHAHERAKQRIARLAADLVEPGQTVLLDAGTTTAAVATRLAHRADVTLVTLGLSSAIAAADGVCGLVILGGRLRRPNAAMTGALLQHGLDLVVPDVALLGCDALDPTRGINCPDLDQAGVKSMILARATRAWVLADSSKLTTPPRYPYFSPVPATVGVVTDAPEGSVAALRARGHQVLSLRREA